MSDQLTLLSDAPAPPVAPPATRSAKRKATPRNGGAPRVTPPYNGVAPRVTDSATSEAAAEAVEAENKRLTYKQQVYTFIVSQGAAGATRKEIAAGTGLSENTVRPRVCELMSEWDARHDQARVREAPSGAVRNGCAVLLAGEFLALAFKLANAERAERDRASQLARKAV